MDDLYSELDQRLVKAIQRKCVCCLIKVPILMATYASAGNHYRLPYGQGTWKPSVFF